MRRGYAIQFFIRHSNLELRNSLERPLHNDPYDEAPDPHCAPPPRRLRRPAEGDPRPAAGSRPPQDIGGPGRTGRRGDRRVDQAGRGCRPVRAVDAPRALALEPAYCVPANAAADNSSTFYLTLGSGFGCTAGIHNAPQTNVNDGSTGPGSAGRTYTDCSDTFSNGQSLQAGTTVANLNFWNTSASKDCTINAELQHYHASGGTVTSLGTSGTITVPANTNTLTAFNWSWSTSAATFADNDRLYFLMTFTGSGSNCNNTTLSYTTLANPTYFTLATIVPENVAGLLPLALAVPLAARWWKRRRV